MTQARANSTHRSGRLTRRQFLLNCAKAAAGTVLATRGDRLEAVQAAPSAPAKPKRQEVWAATTPDPEAPALAQSVAAGKLAPVAERIPTDPKVIAPLRDQGRYGGTLRRMELGSGLSNLRMLMYGPSWFHWQDDGGTIAPGLCRGWQVSAGTREWTFSFRAEHKWSDGESFTVDDVLFWWNDLVLNSEHSDEPPDWALIGGAPMTVTKLDAYTLRFSFQVAAPLVLENLAAWVNGAVRPRMQVPEHYLRQYHPDYSTYPDFSELDQRLNDWAANAELPRLTSWVPHTVVAGDKAGWSRNPYCYYVDTWGNQLPYIDGVETSWANSVQGIREAILRGEVDFQLRPYQPLTILPALRAGQGSGGYQVGLWESGSGSGPVFYCNYDHPEPDKRALYRQKQFRQALSLAIDRQAIQDDHLGGYGELTTGTLSPKAVEHNVNPVARAKYESWRDAFNDYDPARARALLDSIGVVDRNGDGWRQKPDGSSLQLRIDYSADAAEPHPQVAAMVAADWRAIGLYTYLNAVEGWQLAEMNRQATFDIRNSWDVGDGPNYLIYVNWAVPVGDERWAPKCGLWYRTGGAEGWMPPAGGAVEQLQSLYGEARVLVDENARHSKVLEMIDIHISEGPFFIGTVANCPRILVTSIALANVPVQTDLATGGFVDPWIVPFPALTYPEQYAFNRVFLPLVANNAGG